MSGQKKKKKIPVNFDDKYESYNPGDKEQKPTPENVEKQDTHFMPEPEIEHELVESAESEEPLPITEEVSEEKISEPSASPENQLKEEKDRFLRLQAEFINYKKRIEKESLELASYLKGEIVKNFLPISDDFKHMLDKVRKEHDDISAVIDGMDMIFKKYMQIISNIGVQTMDSANKEFDPEFHEALMVQSVSDKKQNNKILQVYQEGYMLNDRVIRPAKVIVGKYEEKN